MFLMSAEPKRKAMATKVHPRIRHLFKATAATLDPGVLGSDNTMENVLSLLVLWAGAQEPRQLAGVLAGFVGQLDVIEGKAAEDGPKPRLRRQDRA